MSLHPARLVLATLRAGPGPDGDLPAAWRSVDPRGLDALLRAERGSQWLLRRLGATGALAGAPASFVEGLRAVARSETAANLLVDAEAEAVLRRLAEWQVPVVLLKGTARRAAAGHYPYADARATQDVDLLLPGDLVQPTWDRLRAEGFVFATDPAATPEGHHHPPPLRAPDGRVAVELHSSTSRAVPPGVAWRRATEGGRDLEWHGLAVRVPGATELVWHALAHALTQGPFGFRLRYFLDAAVVLATTEPVAWDRVAERLASVEVDEPHVAQAWLGAAGRLAGCDIPGIVTAGRPPFNLARALCWRLTVVRRGPRHPQLVQRLMEESVRVDLGQGATPTVPGTSLVARGRRRLTSHAARAAYRVWRAGVRVPA